MNTVTQTMKFRQYLLSYAEKHGVTQAAIKYNVNRQYIYRWKRRYNGDNQSLANRSHRPHHHPNQHTEAELQQITNFRRRNPNTGLVVLWVKLRQKGYKRSITGLYRVLRRQGQLTVKLPNPKYIPKPYEKMHFPGERVQIDVKFVPVSCIVGDAAGEKFTSILPLTNSPVGGIWKPFRCIAPIPPPSEYYGSNVPLFRRNGYRQSGTMIP